MNDYDSSPSTADLYWRDKVQGPTGTLAAAFITIFVVGVSVATAASATVIQALCP